MATLVSIFNCCQEVGLDQNQVKSYNAAGILVGIHRRLWVYAYCFYNLQTFHFNFFKRYGRVHRICSPTWRWNMKKAHIISDGFIIDFQSLFWTLFLLHSFVLIFLNYFVLHFTSRTYACVISDRRLHRFCYVMYLKDGTFICAWL